VILLDTNLLSALMQTVPDPVVLAWLDRQPPEEVWTTTINVFEIRFGLSRLAEGRRRRMLEESFALLLREDLGGRVAPFDMAAAAEAGLLAARREAAGRPGEIRDTMIGGIAIARRAVLATRNTRHFSDLGTEVVDPWSAPRGT
jgi:predicted nucleic acid-binding protein